MTPLAAAFLESRFEEGDDFLQYVWHSESAVGPMEKVIARVMQSDIRGVMHASNDVMQSLAGQPVRSLALVQALDAAGDGAGVVRLRIAFLHTKFTHFVVVFSGEVSAAVAEVRVAVCALVKFKIVCPHVPGRRGDGAHGCSPMHCFHSHTCSVVIACVSCDGSSAAAPDAARRCCPLPSPTLFPQIAFS